MQGTTLKQQRSVTMTTKSNAWTKLAVAGLAIAGAVAFTAASSASAKDPQELQLKGQPVSKLTEVLGEPKEKAPLSDGGKLYIYAYEHILKGGHTMRGTPRPRKPLPESYVMSEDMRHQCRAEFDVSKDGVIRDSGISGEGCPTK
jgi:hypothetical protein